MRPDMKKVIVSRPKRGGGTKFYRSDKIKGEGENLANGESMRIRHISHWGGKERSGLYGPFRRFLRSRVGQPWNKVYSEICENSQDELGHVLRERIEWTVELNCILIDGEVYTSQGRNLSWRDFYVHPQTGNLCSNEEKRKRYKRTKPTNKFIELNGQEYYFHDGIWYRVRTAIYVREPDVRRHTVDDLFGNTNPDSLHKAYGCSRYVIWKQQAGSKECKQLNSL